VSQQKSRPGEKAALPKNIADNHTVQPGVLGPWELLADCPVESRPWAAVGYRVGWLDGVDEVHAQIGRAGRDTAAVAAKTSWRLPRHEALVRAREESNERCVARCGRCSRCARAAQVERNLVRYGSPDFPGVAA
jgi:hypothetical protein